MLASFAGSADYNSASNQVTFTIGKATPTLTWNNPGNIVYRTAIGSTQLDASANVAGSFVYSPGSGTVLTVGSHTLSVTFTPSDGTDYSTATATVTINVTPPTITLNNPGNQTNAPGNTINCS